MSHEVTEPSPHSTTPTNERIDFCSPTTRALETTHRSSPPGFSVARKLSNGEREPSESECDSQCPDGGDPNLAVKNHVAPNLSDLREDADRDRDQTYGGLLNDSFHEQREACNWTTGALTVTFAKSLSDDSPRDIDITPTIGYGKNVPKTCNDSNCYWLLSRLNRNDEEFREKHLYPLVTGACLAAGFRVYCKYVKRQSRFEVRCCRGVYYHKGNNKWHNEQVRDDAEVDNTTTCKFKFSVYWDGIHERWMIPHKQRGCINHCGHPKIKPEHFDAYQEFMPIFQQMCNSASAPGELGEKRHAIMKKGLKKLRREIFSASVNVDKDSACVDCTSYPVISSKKVVKRGEMVTSPDKRDKKRSCK